MNVNSLHESSQGGKDSQTCMSTSHAVQRDGSEDTEVVRHPLADNATQHDGSDPRLPDPETDGMLDTKLYNTDFEFQDINDKTEASWQFQSYAYSYAELNKEIHQEQVDCNSGPIQNESSQQNIPSSDDESEITERQKHEKVAGTPPLSLDSPLLTQQRIETYATVDERGNDNIDQMYATVDTSKTRGAKPRPKVKTPLKIPPRRDSAPHSDNDAADMYATVQPSQKPIPREKPHPLPRRVVTSPDDGALYSVPDKKSKKPPPPIAPKPRGRQTPSPQGQGERERGREGGESNRRKEGGEGWGNHYNIHP